MIPCELAGPTSCNDDDSDGICDDTHVTSDVGCAGTFVGGLLLGILVGGVLGTVVGPKLTVKIPASTVESDSLYSDQK